MKKKPRKNTSRTKQEIKILENCESMIEYII